MKERGILFSAPMVRALLEGRKTQTRRLVSGQKTIAPGITEFPVGLMNWWTATDDLVEDEASKLLRCHLGGPGDRLWVRETWMETPEGVFYRATDPAWDAERANTQVRWRPSIFMPRRASRITLEVADVLVERLHDITEGDARAEGVEPDLWVDTDGRTRSSYRQGFRKLWDVLNAARAPWSDNPWVWRIAFRRLP